jgi:hypothetical protein
LGDDSVKGRMRFFAMLLAIVLTGCAASDFGKYVSEVDATGGVSADPNDPNNAQVTVVGKIYFRDPTARRLPNYSKDK